MQGIVSGLWKGLFGSRQDELNEQVTEESLFQMQHPFARTIEDAQKYGINPITALGSQPSQATYSGSSGESNAGQLLSLIPSIVQGSVSRENAKDSNETSKEVAMVNNQTLADVAEQKNETEKEISKEQEKTKRIIAGQQNQVAILNYELDKLVKNHQLSNDDKRLINESNLTKSQIQKMQKEYLIKVQELAKRGEELTEQKRHNIVSEILSGFDVGSKYLGALLKLFTLGGL